MSDNKMNYLEETHNKEINDDLSKIESQSNFKKRSKYSYQILTTTSIIMGILILTTILAVFSGSISHTTILIDILMIVWHFILIIRISFVEKRIDSADVNPSKSINQDPNYNENNDWI
jgi:hypothetical protein